jgi:N-acetylglucosamine-6-phosphate deacetylase
MGHSNANMDESLKGAEAGASMITHMYNAMQSFHHRHAPG